MPIGIVNLLKVVHIHHNHKGILRIALQQQVTPQLVAVVERCQRVRRYQLVLRIQVDKQDNQRTPEAEYRSRQREQDLRTARNEAARSIARHNQVLLKVLPVLRFEAAGYAANRHHHDIDNRDERQDKIIKVARFQVFV